MRNLSKLILIPFLLCFLCGCGGGEPKDESVLYAFKEEFIVNLAKENSGTYLKVRLGLEVSNAKVLGEVGKMEFKVRDKINYILSRQTLKSISSDSGKDNIKREIKETINKILEKGEVTDVYFYEFVSQ